MPVLTYGSETMLRREEDRSRIRTVQMDKVLNSRIRQLCGVTKGVYEKIDECILRLFGHVERMENYRIAKRVYVGECTGSRSVGRPWQRWIDTVKDYLKKRGLGVKQARRIVYDRCVYGGDL